jgi:hypothetical protein
MPIDLSKATREELLAIHNEVLRHIAEQTKADIATNVAAGHDSHGSNHSNNKMPADFRTQIADVLGKTRT